MSTVKVPPEIEYPESDGKPMGETELHRDWTIRILDILRQRYRGQAVYVASDLLLYYEEGSPTKFIVPDCFVVLNCATHRRRTFQTWKEGRFPDVVIEVTSRSTSRTDMVDAGRGASESTASQQGENSRTAAITAVSHS